MDAAKGSRQRRRLAQRVTAGALPQPAVQHRQRHGLAVRSKDRPTINQARGTRPAIADRMDLTLECIRRHYAEDTDSPLADALSAYGDFFALFDGFREFVDFFHFQDLVTDDYQDVRFFLPLQDFARPGVPRTVAEYVSYREATLSFIAARNRRIHAWVTKHKS